MSDRNDSTKKGAATDRSRLDRTLDDAIVDLDSAVANARAASQAVGIAGSDLDLDLDQLRSMLSDAYTLAAGAAAQLDDAMLIVRASGEGSDR